jgi:hypothetical protein
MQAGPISLVLAVALFAISGLHVYWGAGGNWGWGLAIPEEAGSPAFHPSRLATFGVAGALAAAAGIAVSRGYRVADSYPGNVIQWACLLLGAVFLVRAIGDMRLIGFTKKVRGTRFAAWDTGLYSPLCLALSAAYFYIAVV